MKHPRKSVETLLKGAAYSLPKYQVTNNGLEDAGETQIYICKGDKSNEATMRQQGVLVESLLVVCGKYLTEVNVGDLQNEFSTKAIEAIKEALNQLDLRKQKREQEGTLSTYNK